MIHFFLCFLMHCLIMMMDHRVWFETSMLKKITRSNLEVLVNNYHGSWKLNVITHHRPPMGVCVKGGVWHGLGVKVDDALNLFLGSRVMAPTILRHLSKYQEFPSRTSISKVLNQEKSQKNTMWKARKWGFPTWLISELII